MRILAIETSSRDSDVAILDCTRSLSVDSTGILAAVFAERDDNVWLFSEDGPVTHTNRKKNIASSSSTLIPKIRAVLAKHKLVPADIDLLSVCIGPGSFTGLRIGVVAAKAFAFATGAKVIGVNAMDALACQAFGWVRNVTSQQPDTLPPQENHDQSRAEVAVGVNIGRGEVFAAIYQTLGDNLDMIGKPEIMNPATWVASIPKKTIVTGSALKLCTDKSITESEFTCVPEHLRIPMITTIATLGFASFTHKGSDDFWKLEPLYARPSYAEESKK